MSNESTEKDKFFMSNVKLSEAIRVVNNALVI